MQGIGTVGVTPQLKQAIFERLETQFGVKLPTEAGLDTMAMMEAAATERLKFGLCLGGNLYGSNPDATFAAGALEKLDLLVYLNTTLNTGHAHGLAKETIILPVLARDEEPEPTTQESMFSYVRLSDGGPARHEGPRSEIHVVAELGRRRVAEYDACRLAGTGENNCASVKRWGRLCRDWKRFRKSIGRGRNFRFRDEHCASRDLLPRRARHKCSYTSCRIWPGSISTLTPALSQRERENGSCG